MSNGLKIWLWISVVFTIAGAFLLYPIGVLPLNIIFILVKIGMLCGLIMLLFFKARKGLCVFSVFCAGAIIMEIVKWVLNGRPSFFIICGIILDVLMPVVACKLVKKGGLNSKKSS